MYLLLCSFFSFYIGTLVLYRLLFHPLRTFPGPVIAALTDWYEGYFNIVKGGAFITELERLHKVYGKLGGPPISSPAHLNNFILSPMKGI
ncbi:uncharacterized protein C8R40DRAFT_1075660 [Lentinula edodes]|uniref:uncharacterized protein n=1 Tax=Lentinula edodes TaxID=5353 RepID=UPI001E8DE8EF|nr:uncharacterized protein C8R40DRAFT_1075660 [Lentinula edodes]KAH7880890.1 hypothetical protein C8R40DRAFT_1075660 [Lentinula edodes]